MNTYTLILHRYEIDKTKLRKQLQDLHATITHEEDYLLEIEAPFLSSTLTTIPEIKESYQILTPWKKLSYPTLKKDSLAALQPTPAKTYTIKTIFYNKIPISAKSIYKHLNPYLKHDGYHPIEDHADIILIPEFRKEGITVQYRISIQPTATQKKITPFVIPMNNLSVALEEPTLITEISDFLRLCYIFKINFYIITNNPTMQRLVDKAKAETKGLNEGHFTITITKELPKGFTSIGFSKHATNTEKELQTYFQENKKTLLVFGNDTYGLSQHVRDQLDMQFRLTPELKKPLKANQALSYVLGISTALHL